MLNTLSIAINNNAGWSVHGVNTFNTILIFSLLQEPQIVMATKQKTDHSINLISRLHLLHICNTTHA